jgi:hypothetical protein
MENPQSRETFDTGLKKIRLEIKSRLVPHGLFGSVTETDISGDEGLHGSTIEITVKGRTSSRSFDRKQIEDCHLRVGGGVLAGVTAMIDELAN